MADDAVTSVSPQLSQRGVEMSITPAGIDDAVRIDPILASRILEPIIVLMATGLPQGARVVIEFVRAGVEVGMTLSGDTPVASLTGRDDQMASSVKLWVSRRLLEQVGGRLEQGAEAVRWTIWLQAGA